MGIFNEDTVGGAASGAQTGAQVGGLFGQSGLGAVVGAGLGAIAGFGANKSKKRAARRQRAAIRAQYREVFRELNMNRDIMIGRQRSGYAAAGVEVGEGTPALVVDETTREFSRAWLLAEDQKSREIKGSTVNTNYWAAGINALEAGGSIYSAFK